MRGGDGEGVEDGQRRQDLRRQVARGHDDRPERVQALHRLEESQRDHH